MRKIEISLATDASSPRDRGHFAGSSMFSADAWLTMQWALPSCQPFGSRRQSAVLAPRRTLVPIGKSCVRLLGN